MRLSPLALLLWLLVVCSAGCDSTTGLDVDLSAFNQIPSLEDLDYGSVVPGVDYDYWEYRLAYGNFEFQVFGSAGLHSREDLDADLLAVFDTVFPAFGFGNACLPGDCYYYVASVRGGTIETWAGPDGFRAFVEIIDSEADAILLARAHDYYWGSEKKTAAVRTVAGGYELVVLKTVEFCDPVQVNLYLLNISRDGTLAERQSAVWTRESGVCI
jgi:hypothetical protein